MAKFELFTDSAGGYRWRLRAANGEKIASSGESYVTKYGVKGAVDRIREEAPGADEEDLT